LEKVEVKFDSRQPSQVQKTPEKLAGNKKNHLKLIRMAFLFLKVSLSQFKILI